MAKAGKQSAAARAKVLSKLKNQAKGAWGKAKNVEPKAKGSRVPGGLVRAVAKISSWKLDETKEKKVPYVAVTSIIMEPAELNGTKMTKTIFMKPSKDQKGNVTKTIDDKLVDLANDIQLMGGDTSETESLDDMCALLDTMCEAGGYYYFNTWTPPGDKQRPNPDTIIMIQGPAKDYLPDESEEVGDDDEEEGEDEEDGDEEEEEDEEEKKPTRKPKPKPGKKPAKPPKEEDEEEESEDESEDESEEEGDEGDGDEEESEEDWTPAKGEVYYFKANPKAKKAEGKVIKVYEKSQAVDIKRLEDDKVFSKVPWSALSGDEE